MLIRVYKQHNFCVNLVQQILSYKIWPFFFFLKENWSPLLHSCNKNSSTYLVKKTYISRFKRNTSKREPVCPFLDKRIFHTGNTGSPFPLPPCEWSLQQPSLQREGPGICLSMDYPISFDIRFSKITSRDVSIFFYTVSSYTLHKSMWFLHFVSTPYELTLQQC